MNNEKKEGKVNALTCARNSTICIVLSYILIYGLLTILFNCFGDNSYLTIVILVICVICTWKSMKEVIVDHLSSLPWPVFILLTFFLSMIVGLFTAPYYVGRWIGRKVNFLLVEVEAHDGDVEALYLLGKFYINGHGIEQNVAMGISKLIEAADKGHDGARKVLEEEANKGNKEAIKYLKSRGFQ